MISCDVHYPYYSLDGSCNSLGSPTRGMTFMPFRRVVKPMDMNEADAVFVKQFEMDGTLCMEHRASFKKQKLKYDPIVRNFAEFVSLDMVQTLGTVRNTGDTHDWDDDLLKNGECPSHYEEETLNRITSFIDGSQIYGTTFHVSSSLRKMENGLLHIPLEEVQSFHTQMEREQGMSVELFITLFKLEHNRLASQIKDAYKDYGVILGRKEDETIYQESRRIIIGVLQHIIYDKFLPVILGSDLFNRFELTTIKNTYYDRNLNPSIFNGFLTAFFDIFTEPCDNMNKSFSEDDLMSDINSIINLNKYPHLIAIFKDFNDDHGTYQSYKNLCGLANQTISNITWTELLDVFKGNESSIDLFSGGFVEEPVQDGLIGPTFACIIAYQFHLAKAGDRHFYSNVRHGYPSHHNPHTDQTLIQSLQKPKPKKLKKSFIRQIEAKFYKDDPNFNYIRDSYRFNYDEVNEIRHRSLGGLFCDNGRISHTSQFSFYKKEGKWNHIIPCDSILPFNTRIFIDSSNANLIKKK
ncbi:chorion peroxidase [Lepeophtheirus salmonis]|uniref:chorion peroxidase n=1 Tax=Lepeophtheirus salmonis TaxID=72036 RepID=UPI001AEB77B6|nr:chorion peroxidase-like [Lepeophtheirus salmonis]